MKLRKLGNKKGAIELSMGTIVVLVLAMSMLILGLVLIRTIFTGAKYNVDQINQKVESEINKLFSEDKKIVVYLANNMADIKPGAVFQVAFGVKNLIRGGTEATKFTYEVSLDEGGNKCKIKEKEAMSWISVGSSGSFTLAYDDQAYQIIRFEIPAGAPGCIIRYNIDVKGNGQFYTSASFDVNIVSKS